MEAHHTSNLWTYLEVKRSKVKVTKPINAHTVNAQYLPDGNAYELQTCIHTEHEDPYHRQAPWPQRSPGRLIPGPEVRHIFRTERLRNLKLGTQMEYEDPYQRQATWPPKLKIKVARSHDASDRCWQISRERNFVGTPKLTTLPITLAIIGTSSKVKSQRSRSPDRLILRQEVRYIFRTERHTNLKFGTQVEYEDPHRRQAPWPPRSKVKVAMSRDAADICWPICRERKVPEIPKLVGRRLPTPQAIMNTSFKVNGQRSRSPGRLILRPEMRHIFETERPTNFKLGTQLEHE